MTNFKMYIGGEWKEAVAGEYFDGVNPYTGKAWAKFRVGEPRMWTLPPKLLTGHLAVVPGMRSQLPIAGTS
jgi:hypothetical protein